MGVINDTLQLVFITWFARGALLRPIGDNPAADSQSLVWEMFRVLVEPEV